METKDEISATWNDNLFKSIKLTRGRKTGSGDSWGRTVSHKVGNLKKKTFGMENDSNNSANIPRVFLINFAALNLTVKNVAFFFLFFILPNEKYDSDEKGRNCLQQNNCQINYKVFYTCLVC